MIWNFSKLLELTTQPPPPPWSCPFSWAFPSMEQNVHFIGGFDDLYLLNFKSPHISSIMPFKLTETLCECHTKTSQLWNWNRSGVSLALNEAIHFRADGIRVSCRIFVCWSNSLWVHLAVFQTDTPERSSGSHNSKGFESITSFACECVSVLYTFLISVAKTGSLSGPYVLIGPKVLIWQKVIFDVQIQKCDMVACHRSALSSCPHLLSVSGNTMLLWQSSRSSPHVVAVLGNRTKINMDKIHKGIKNKLSVFSKCCEYLLELHFWCQ